MEATFYTIGNLTIMEIKMEGEYEYYIRETEDRFDYFRFSFGSDKQFSQMDLENLMENGYFD